MVDRPSASFIDRTTPTLALPLHGGGNSTRKPKTENRIPAPAWKHAGMQFALRHDLKYVSRAASQNSKLAVRAWVGHRRTGNWLNTPWQTARDRTELLGIMDILP